MEDRLVKVLAAGDTLAVWLYESARQDGGAYLALKHRDAVRGMQGEVIIAPAEVAVVAKALIEGAEILTSRGYYVAGIEDAKQKRV